MKSYNRKLSNPCDTLGINDLRRESKIGLRSRKLPVKMKHQKQENECESSDSHGGGEYDNGI